MHKLPIGIQGFEGLRRDGDIHLRRWEKAMGISPEGGLSERFQNLLIEARSRTGLRSVVLVDEYDKPLLEVMEDQERVN